MIKLASATALVSLAAITFVSSVRAQVSPEAQVRPPFRRSMPPSIRTDLTVRQISRPTIGTTSIHLEGEPMGAWRS